jgi:hypothetical protein
MKSRENSTLLKILLVFIPWLIFPTFAGLPYTPSAEYFMPIIIVIVFLEDSKLLFNKFTFGAWLMIIYWGFQNYVLNRESNGTFSFSNIGPSALFAGIFTNLLYIKYFSFIELVKIKRVFLFFMLLTSITSLIGSYYFPTAARDLAGALSKDGDTALSAFYMMVGIGNYDFYVVLLFVLPLLFFEIAIKNNWEKKYYYIVILFSIICIYFTQYSTLIILACLQLILIPILKKSRNISNFLFRLLLVLIATLLIQNLLVYFLEFVANQIGQEDLSVRLKNIVDRLNGNVKFDAQTESDFEIEQEDIYIGAYQRRILLSFSTWTSNIFFGGDNVGGHNFLIDILGFNGLVGFSLFIYYFGKIIVTTLKLFQNLGKVVYFNFLLVFITLGIMKTIIPFSLFFVGFFVLPLIMQSNSKFYTYKLID